MTCGAGDIEKRLTSLFAAVARQVPDTPPDGSTGWYGGPEGVDGAVIEAMSGLTVAEEHGGRGK